MLRRSQPSLHQILSGSNSEDEGANEANPAAPAPAVEDRFQQQSTQLNNYAPTSGGSTYPLVILVLLIVSIVTGLFGYKVGLRQGYESGKKDAYTLKAPIAIQPGVATQSPAAMLSVPSVNGVDRSESVMASAPTPAASRLIINSAPEARPVPTHSLSSEARPLPASQRESALPEEMRKKITIQVRTCGSDLAEADALVGALKEAGFDSFRHGGTVYVGRYTSQQDVSAKEAKKRLSRITWKNSKLSDCFFNNLPK